MKSLKELVSEYEKMIVSKTLTANGFDRDQTAKALRIGRRTLDKILERHRLVRPRFARALPIGRTDDEREG